MTLTGDQRTGTGKPAGEMNPAYTPDGARKSDLGKVQRLDMTAYGDEAYPYMVLRQFLDMSGDLFQVCRDSNGDVIAYGIITRSASGDSGWLLSVVVDEPHRRKGIGTALVGQLLDKANHYSLKKILLTVATDNEAAIALYKALGFAAVEVEHHYYGKNEDRLIMCRG